MIVHETPIEPRSVVTLDLTPIERHYFVMALEAYRMQFGHEIPKDASDRIVCEILDTLAPLSKGRKRLS
jgi:hypothetical protein